MPSPWSIPKPGRCFSFGGLFSDKIPKYENPDRYINEFRERVDVCSLRVARMLECRLNQYDIPYIEEPAMIFQRGWETFKFTINLTCKDYKGNPSEDTTLYIYPWFHDILPTDSVVGMTISQKDWTKRTIIQEPGNFDIGRLIMDFIKGGWAKKYSLYNFIDYYDLNIYREKEKSCNDYRYESKKQKGLYFGRLRAVKFEPSEKNIAKYMRDNLHAYDIPYTERKRVSKCTGKRMTQFVINDDITIKLPDVQYYDLNGNLHKLICSVQDGDRNVNMDIYPAMLLKGYLEAKSESNFVDYVWRNV